MLKTPATLARKSFNSKVLLGIKKWNNSKNNERTNKNKKLLINFFLLKLKINPKKVK
mgnify:CR=1 FL=1